MKYPYKIIYSPRRTVSVSISSDNKITVRCPLNYSEKKIEKFLSDRLQWIEKHIKSNEIKLNLNKDVTSFEKIYVKGGKIPLYLGGGKQIINSDGVYVKKLSSLKNLYISAYYNELCERICYVCGKTGLNCRSVGVRDYSSRWGCCDTGGNIKFSYKIFMLPERIQDYIVLHELCHTRYMNHSKDFWNLVESFIPDYKLLRQELKKYDFLTRLY